jgi:hypothetical protein
LSIQGAGLGGLLILLCTNVVCYSTDFVWVVVSPLALFVVFVIRRVSCGIFLFGFFRSWSQQMVGLSVLPGPMRGVLCIVWPTRCALLSLLVLVGFVLGI